MLGENLSVLTEDQVLKAEQRVGFSHPIFTAIEQQLPKIMEHSEKINLLPDHTKQQDYISSNFGFLAEAFVAAGPFDLDAESMIAIWSRVYEIFPTLNQLYPRKAISKLIANAYVIQDLDIKKWHIFPLYMLSPEDLPLQFQEDRNDWNHIASRTVELGDIVQQIHLYLDSSDIKPSDIFTLTKLSNSGDEEAVRKLAEIEKSQSSERREDPLLYDLTDNFRHAIFNLQFTISEAEDYNI